MTFQLILFFAFGAVLLGSALAVILVRNPVHAALFLVLSHAPGKLLPTISGWAIERPPSPPRYGPSVAAGGGSMPKSRIVNSGRYS